MDPGQAIGKIADVQPWRRKLHASKSFTPGYEAHESDDYIFPPTPRRRGPKRMISEYFGQSNRMPMDQAISSSHFASWPLEDHPSNLEELNSVMCVLMSKLCSPLDVRFNPMLLRIFENFMTLQDENVRLKHRLEEELVGRRADLSECNMLQKDWADEMQDLRDEVKRLEVLLANASQHSISELSQTQQNGNFDKRNLSTNQSEETMFEFLERTRIFEDRGWSKQRATMRTTTRSPSARDRRISKTLTQFKSMTNLRVIGPFDELCDRPGSPLTVASLAEQWKESRHPCEPELRLRTSTSDETFSSFSCEGDLQPEVEPRVPRDNVANVHEELTGVGHFARALALRRPANTPRVTPHLHELVVAQPAGHYPEQNMTNGLSLQASENAPATSLDAPDAHAVARRMTVRAKASKLLLRLRPQLSVGALAFEAGSLPRKFSFEPGDDLLARSAQLDGIPAKPDLIWMLRKSASMSSLRNSMTGVEFERPHPLEAAQPTRSAISTESRPSSRMPTSLDGSVVRATLGCRREDSEFSLVTAIRDGDLFSRGNVSRSSSNYSSFSTSRKASSITGQFHDRASSLRYNATH